MSNLPSLAELRKRYVQQGHSMPRNVEALLAQDPRIGARQILEAIQRRRRRNRSEAQRLRKLARFEEELWSAGTELVAGIDEAGMSPLAGPVVAAAVVLPVGYRLVGVDDSKKIRPDQRAALAQRIKQDARAWAVGKCEPEEIDRINIYRAGLLAMRRAVEGLGLTPGYLLIDARSLPELEIPQRGIIKGDQKSISIAAASIIAKTTRDGWMVELNERYPGYGFERHKGYPVADHVDALARLGVCEVHRRSFAPVRKALGLEAEQTELF